MDMLNPQMVVKAAQRLKKLKQLECYDPNNLESRPTQDQEKVLRDIQEISHRFVTSGNQSGKSQLGARETAWILTETHPYWKRPEKIGSDTLQLLVLGRVQKQIEEVLWRKISGFLNMDDLHLQRAGGALQSVTYKPNGNKIIFLSHHSVSEAREKAQAYTADYVWIDELPGSVKLIEELHRRVMARDGRFLATFTPKVLNKEIRDLVDNSRAPVARKYQFAMLDNPIYSEAKKLEILQTLETYPEAYRRTILYGDWYSGEAAVYHIPDSLIATPIDYHPSWRHVESSDPALSSKFGLTAWAECPTTHIWYLIRADYLKDIPDPNEMFATVQARLANLNLVKRIADPEANWYVNIARTGGVNYVSPNKVGRKGELIKNLQVAMTQGRIKVAPWCELFIKELETCQWSETSVDNIVNSHSFHLLDSAQYFVDMIPKPEKIIVRTSWQQDLRKANEDRKKAAAIKNNPTWRRQWKLRR
jgi:phage terminase large subunit-like protein